MNALPVETATFLILFARVGAVLMLLPVFSEEGVPAQIRLLISLGLALGSVGTAPPVTVMVSPPPTSTVNAPRWR